MSCLTPSFTLSGGGGLGHDIWHMTESCCIHSQELLLLACLACYGYVIYNDLPGLTSCDNIGLVWLMSYHCTMCTRHPDLVS